ncbi:sugar transporter [Moraxella atlantae]|uniref:Sugar efflux transporter B n=1 Tax=Faucicola atlantae TaxID=34059 RepID=A0A378Q2Q9_9GAMM|nr:sugar transporter [Moraxella atlantae]OPH37171.1 sugar transporter [Moraxella atlantae]STY94478.1 Sugar efflux transporter B [Moraxella atlantae]
MSNPALRQRLANQPTYANRVRRWRVVVMAISAFIFNTTEFVPIALLTDIGASFAMPVESVGHMITVYAWLVAVLSLPGMLLTARFERKRLLMWLFALFIAGHVISVLASSFAMLLVGRATIALAHAVFWSITASLVVRVAPRGWQTKALGLLSMGSALATVLGLPLGRLIGQWLGWRATFGTIGVAALIAMGLVAWLLPQVPSRNVGSVASLPQIARNVPLLVVYALTVLAVTAHFTAYSYVEPFVLQINHLSENFATVVLLLFGVAGLLASAVFGQVYDKRPTGFVLVSLLGLLVSLLVVAWIGASQVGWMVLALVWGGCMTAIGLALQLQVLKLAPNATDVAMSIFSGIYNIGIGGGALVGSLVIAAWGLGMVGNVGALILLLALAVFGWSVWYGRRA